MQTQTTLETCITSGYVELFLASLAMKYHQLSTGQISGVILCSHLIPLENFHSVFAVSFSGQARRMQHCGSKLKLYGRWKEMMPDSYFHELERRLY